MEFTFDFRWKDMVLMPVYRADEATVSATSRVAFSGMIGTLEQTPKELNTEMENSERQDFGEVKFTQEDGRIRGRAVITTIGVYPYVKEDGTIQWELRHPDDVYTYDSLQTLELLPLTNNHPSEKVTKDNIKNLQVGHLGEFVMVDTMHGFITNSVVVSESVAMEDVSNGKRALSCGYVCDILPESGVWNGVPYTARQKNIRYNHVSIVDRGRAGDDTVMKFDSYEGVQTKINIDTTAITADVNTDEEVTMSDKNLKSVKLDGVEYEAEPAVITALHTATVKLDDFQKIDDELKALKADKAVVDGERDSLKEEVAKLTKEVADSIKTDQLEGLFQKRQKLDEAGKLAEVEEFDKLDVKGKMEAVVLKVSPGAQEALDSRKDSDQYMVYLESRFDSAVETLRKDAENLTDNLSSVSNGISTETDDNVIKSDDDEWKVLVNAHVKKAV